MRFTVAICTWNRAALLAQALASLCALRATDHEVEVLVVDNNSSDATRATAEGFRDRLDLAYVFEARQGLSHARNAAIAHARGDALLWLDDDVIVDRDWLDAYARAFLSRPEAGFLGGPVRPRFEGTPPAWLRAALPRVAFAYALIDLGPQPFEFGRDAAAAPVHPGSAPAAPLPAHALPFGANFAVRRSVLSRHGFSPRLGRRGAGGMLGEESDLLRRLLADGVRGFWVPEARVEHWIGRERQARAYLAAYYELAGATRATRSATSPPGRLWFGRAEGDLRAYAVQSAHYLWRLARSDPRWLDCLIDRSLARGRLRAGYRGKPAPDDGGPRRSR